MSDNGEDFQDRLLLQKACRQTCGESLTLLYQKYRKPICDFLHSRGADGLAKDICQEVFCRIHEGRCGYDGSSDVKCYLFGVAGNIYMQELKLLERREGVYSRLLMEERERIREYRVSIEMEIDSEELYRIITKKIAALPPNTRQAIQQVFIDGIPRVNAARMSKCGLKAFCDRLQYGLKNLRQKMQ